MQKLRGRRTGPGGVTGEVCGRLRWSHGESRAELSPLIVSHNDLKSSSRNNMFILTSRWIVCLLHSLEINPYLKLAASASICSHGVSYIIHLWFVCQLDFMSFKK